MENKIPILWLVVPCFNEEEVITDTLNSLEDLLNDLKIRKLVSEESLIELIDDGSTDSTWDVIKNYKNNVPNIHALRLAHNKGHQTALFAGLMESRKFCDISISLDADLQDDINVIEEMIIKYLNGSEIVYGVRNDRSTDRVFKRFTAKAFYDFMKALGTEIIPEHADFRLLDKNALDYLSEYTETNLFLRGIIPQLGLDSDIVYYKRHKRIKGKSKYSLNKMISLAWEGITSLSEKPLQLSFIASIGTLLNGIRIGISSFYNIKTKDLNIIRFEIWMLMSLQMMLIYIYGEYVAKTYKEIKKRPRYQIKETI